MDSMSHAPNYPNYKNKDVFVRGKNKCVEIVYDEIFTLTDQQLENILQFCNQIEYIDLKFVTFEQINLIFSNEHQYFDNLKQIKNADESKFTEEMFCNFIKTNIAQTLELIQYTNKNLFGLALKRIFDRNSLKQVKEINFSDCIISAQNESFQRFFQSEQLSQVSKLNLNSIESLDDESLKIISTSSYLLNLQELDISQCPKITHKGLQKFSENLQKNLPFLRHLRIGGIINPNLDKGLNKYFFNPTNKMIECLVKSVPNLITLDLSKSQMLTDKVVKCISETKSLQNLSTLILSKCPNLTNKSFELFHLSSNNLQKLELVDFSYTNISLELKTATKFLRKLKIIGCMNIDWSRLYKYLDMSIMTQEIHFDSDILEYKSNFKQNEGEFFSQAVSKLSNKKIYLNIILDSSLENIIKFFEKQQNLDIRVFSEIYPEFQLERYIVKLFKKQSNRKKFKIKDIQGSSIKEKIEQSAQKSYKYKNYQILEIPLTVLDQDYDVENQQTPINSERFEDLKRILNGRLFLEFHYLDLKKEQQFAHLIIKPLAQSKFTRGLEMIDFSNSQINDDDLLELTKSSYFQKLEQICINNCQEITEIGINGLINTIQLFPKLKEIQVQQKLLNFDNLNYSGLKKRANLKLIVDTLQISNNQILQDENLFYQYAVQFCQYNQANIKTIYLLGTPLLIIKILNQLHQPQSSPLQFLHLNFTIGSENDILEIMVCLQLIQNFQKIENLFFDFKKLRFLSQSLMKGLFKSIESLTGLKQFQIMIKKQNILIKTLIFNLFSDIKKLWKTREFA